MPRPPRLQLAGLPQHVVQRGVNRFNCFFDDEDRKVYLQLLRKYAQRNGCAVHAYVLMSNHVHLLMTPRKRHGVSKLIQDIGRSYVRFINEKHDRVGTLFQGRFSSSLVDGNRYCLACYRYIELNPVRARMVSAPHQYRWSSFGHNALGSYDPVVAPHDTWLGLAGDGPARQVAYRRLFDDALGPESLERIRLHLRKGLPLGGKRFLHQLEQRLGKRVRPGKPGRPRKANESGNKSGSVPVKPI